LSTPDRFPGEREEEGLKLEPSSADPDTVGGVRLVSGAFRMRDNSGVFDPRTGGGISESEHTVLDTLLHELDESFEGVPTRNADGVMSSVVVRDQSDSPNIRTFDNLTVDGDGIITGYRVRQHDGTGSVVETITGSGDADEMAVDKT
jgi:hypothetical protein